MYEIILYDTEDERCPVQELLDSLEPKLLAKTLRTIDLLELTDLMKHIMAYIQMMKNAVIME